MLHVNESDDEVI